MYARREMSLIFRHINLTRSTFGQSTYSMFLLFLFACLTATASEAGNVSTDSADTIAVELVVEGC